MHNYKFRGQNALGQWHTGYLIIKNKACYIRHHGLESYVFNTTVGQFTGLKDIKGIEIYHGDIVLYKKMPFTILWDKGTCSFRLFGTNQSYPLLNDLKLKVINNIYNK